MVDEHWSDKDAPVHPVSAPDFLPNPQRRALQLHRLQSVVRLAYEQVPLFRSRMEKQKRSPDSVASLEDIRQLPFTVKNDLRDTYPYGLLACPLGDVVRLHASSGTTGKPIAVAYTRSDMNVWMNVMARTFAACGVRAGDIVQNAYGYGLFTGGLGVHYGLEAMGATVIPISGGNSERQIMLMKDFGSTVIGCTPSYFLHLMDQAALLGVGLRELSLHTGVFGAEPWTEEMRARIEGNSGIRAYDIYGLSEIIGPGVASECSAQNGLHLFEDHFYPEIIDPDTLEPLPDGETGELVLTTLSKRAMPMIRYRTRDLTRIVSEPCSCGRTIRRMVRVAARSDDMLIVRGVNVFPSQIEQALLRVEGTLPHYQIVLTREHDLDQMKVLVEVTPEVFSDRIQAMQCLRGKLEHGLAVTLGIRAKVALVEPHTLRRSEGKAVRVVDQRKTPKEG